MIIGMDFGTTNTGAATYDGQDVRLIPLDSSSPTPNNCRSAVYITRGGNYHLGSQALDLYFRQNVGRPSKFRKVKVGEIVQIFAELPTFYRDVFVFEDEYSPGRLFTSIKTALRNQNYFGTVYQDTWYSASDLVAIFLLGMRLRIERELGEPANEVVLGRPVYFSANPEEDQVAQRRLLDSAFKAGFERVYLEYEPIAAALSYEKEIKDKEIVLVFDFGGGTLDFTIMEIGDPRRRKVLATGGIPVAGDIFDQRLFRNAIPKHLGENDEFIQRGVRYPIPAHIFDLLSTPHEILSLNTPQNMEMLRGIHQGAINKEKTQALLQIVSSNYALLLFDLVERSKRQLSSQVETRLLFEGKDLRLEESITRLAFERAIRREYEAIQSELEKTLDRSGLKPSDIQRVIRTGGSSQIPLFVKLLNGMFGYEKVREIDIFSSVTSGLAIRSREVALGEVDLPAYTPDSTRKLEELSAGAEGMKTKVAEVDLGSIQKRFEVAEEIEAGPEKLPKAALLRLYGGEIELSPAPSASRMRKSKSPIGGLPLPKDADLVGDVVYAPLDSSLLVASDGFKFTSVSLRSLFQAQEVSPGAIRQLLPLEMRENPAALLPWNPEKIESGSLVLVTTFGQARLFDARLFAGQLAQKPYFQSERKYFGLPGYLLYSPEASGEEAVIVAATNLGRAAWASCKEMGVGVYDLIRLRKGEEITACTIGEMGRTLWAVGKQGELLSFSIEAPVNKGTPLHRSLSVIALADPDAAGQGSLYILTTRAWLHRLPAPDTLTPGKARKILHLGAREKAVCSLVIS